jgi:hypothetical protein
LESVCGFLDRRRLAHREQPDSVSGAAKVTGIK